MLRLFLGFGSNLGSKKENILNAYSEIENGSGKLFPDLLFILRIRKDSNRQIIS